jgi:autotransporter-associated beta strand protein
VNNLGPGYSFTGITFADFDGLGSRQLAGGSLSTDSVTTIGGNVNISSVLDLTGLSPVINAGTSSTLTISAPFVLSFSPLGLTVTGDGNTTISGDLFVNGVLKTGAGTLALGSGSYTTGFIDVLDGTVNFTQAGVMVDASVTNDSFLNFTSGAGVAGVSSLGGNGTTTFSGAASIGTLNLTNPGSLTLNAGGSITTLSGAGTVTSNGLLTVGGGTSSATLDGLGGLTTNGLLTLTGLNASNYDGATTVNVGSNLTFTQNALLNGNVTNDGTLNFGGTADLLGTLSGAGSTTITGLANIDELNLGALGSLTLTSGGSITTLNGAGTASIDGGTLTVNTGDYFGTLEGAGNLTKSGVGILRMRGPGAGDYTGTTTVNGGALVFDSSVTLAGQVTNNSYLLFNSGFGTTNTLTMGLDGSGLTEFTGEAVIGTRSGSGDISFQENATIGILLGSGTIGINPGKTVDVSSGNFSGTLQGVGGLSKSGPGTLLMNGLAADDYTGTTTVIDGTLQFDSAVTLAGQVTNDSYLFFMDSLGVTTLTTGLDGSGYTRFWGDAVIGQRSGSGLLELAGNTTITTLNGTGTVDFSAVPITLQVANGNYAGQFAGASTLEKVSGGTLVLAGSSNNFSGDVNVFGGTLEAQSDRALGTGLVRLDGGYLAITGDSSLLLGNNVEQLSNAVVTLGAATPGAAAVTQSLGNLSIRNGVAFIVTQDGSFAAGAPATLSVGTVALDGPWAYYFDVGSGAKLEVRGAVNGSANNTLFVSGAGDTTITGNLNIGSGDLWKSGSGTLVLSGVNTSFSGDVNVLGGTLEAQSDRALGTGLVRLNGGNLAITSDSALLLGNNVEQLTSATVTLGAANVGATAVTQSLGNLSMSNGVTLNVQQDGTFAAGAPATLSVGTVALDGPWAYYFNVGSGAKLEVRGAVNHTLNNDLVVYGAGDTTITGNLNLGTGDLYKFDTGTMRLLSANTFSGNVDVYGGTLITANNGLQNVSLIYVHTSGTLNGVNYNTSADLAIDQGGTATFSAAASAITGTIWNNGSLTLNPALGGNSTITLNEFYGSGTTTITRGNLTIYNNALTLGPSVLDPFTYNNTLPADLTWGYGAGGGGNNVLNLIGTLTADISGGTVNTTNLFANYIFDVDMLGDRLNATSGRPFGIAGPSMGGTNVFLNVNVSGSATVGRIIVDGSGTVNFAGTAEVVTLENGQVNLTGTLGEFTNVEGGAITSTSADVKITHLTGGTHSFNGQSTTITNFTGGTASLNGVQALVTTFGGTATATATSNISVGTMNGGSLTLQGSGPSSFITRLDGGTLNINGSDVLVTVNAGNSPAIGAGASVIGNGSLTKLTVATLNLNTINLSGTTRHQEGIINVWGDNNSLGTVINSSTLNFLSNTGSNSIASLQGNSPGVINFATDSSIGEVSGSGVLTINDVTKTLTIQGGSFSGTISGAGNLFKSNAGVLVLSGTNVDNYTGQTTVNGGTLEFSSAVTLTGAVYNAGNLLLFTSATGTTTLSSLLNDFSATTIFTGASSVTNVTNANGSTLRFNGATNITGSLNNLFGGFVEINAGGTISVLQGDSVTRINNVGVSINQRFNDGELQVYASSTINELFGNGRITLGSTLSVNSGATAGIIDGNGSLTKNGVGLLTLSGANVDNYSGNTTVNNGTLEFAHDGVFLAGQVSVGGSGTLNFTASTGTTQLNGGLVTSGNTFIGNNAILADTYNYGNNLTIVGNVTGNHYLESSAGSASTVIGGTALLSHLRNYAGVIDINGLAGSSSIALIQNFAVTNIAGEVSGNTIQNYAGLTIGGNATFGDVRTYGGTTSIGGNLINCNYLENNSSTQVVGNASITSLRNYSGITTIGGALSASDIVNNGGQLINVTGNANITSQIENNGTANFGSTSTIWSLWGSGTANFAGAAQIQYRTGNGTANFADDSNVWSLYGDGSVTIASGKTLTLSTNYFWGSLSGDGSISKITGDTLVLGGSNVDGYQGSTTVNAGALVFDTASTLAGQVTNNATLSFTSGSGLTTLTTGLAGSGATTFAGDTSVGTLNGTGDATVSIANGKTLTVSNGSYAGTLNGAGSLVKANGGTLVFTGVNADDYQGSTTVDAGTLTFTQAVTLASQVTNNATLNFTNAGNTALTTGLAGAGATSFSGDTSVGTLDGTNTASVSIAGGKVLTVNSGSFAGSLTGGGSLVKSTGGSLTLSGVGAGNYVGTTTVDAGTLEFTQNVTLLGQVTNNSTLNFVGAGTTTLTGGLTGSGTTTFSGNGSITSRSGTGVVNFLGNVAIANVTGSGDLNIASGKSLTIQQGVYSGSITGSGDLVKTTGGELELIGSSSNYGATVVQAGLLTVNSDVTTSGVTVAAGASLGGSGTINGNVVVNGFLAPGNSPGILTVNGTETLANNSTFQAEIGGTTAGTGNNFHDQSNVNGNVVIGTGVDLDIISWNGFTTVARGDALTLVKATGGIAGRFADTAGSGLTGWTLFDNSSDAAHQFGNLYGTGLSAAQTFGAWGTNANRTAVAGALWTTAVTETTNSATTAGANRVGFIDTNSNAGRAALALVNAGANTDALLDSYSPESFLGLTDYAQMTARTLADGALNQTTSYTLGDWGVGAGYSSVANTFTAGSSSAFDRRLSSNTTYANFSYHLNPRWKAGLFFGHNVGSINSAANSTNLNGNVVGLSLNGSVDWHYPVSLKAAISSSSLRFGSTRTMTTATSGDDQIVSGTGSSSSADTKLTDTSAQVSASMLIYTKGRLSLSPSVGLVYGTSKSDAFTETGTGANLAVAGMSSNSTRGVIGLGVGYEVSAELALSMSLGLEKKLNSDDNSVSATFAGARDANFSVVGRDTSGSVISTLGLGISYRLPEGYSANLNAEFRSANPFHNDKRVNLSINRRF